MSKNKSHYNELGQAVFERIERYLRGSMTKEEENLFEQEMQQDHLLLNEVELQQELQAALAVEAAGEAYHAKQDSQEPESSKVISLSWVWKVAAALVIIAIPLYFLFFQQPTDLYQKYYQADPGLPTEMGVTDQYEFQDAMVDYKMKNYQKAKDKWTALAEQQEDNDTLHYYLAMADLNLGNLDVSYKKLDLIPTQSTFYVNALWYQALIAIQQKDFELAKAKLEELDTQQANGLLRELP